LVRRQVLSGGILAACSFGNSSRRLPTTHPDGARLLLARMRRASIPAASPSPQLHFSFHHRDTTPPYPTQPPFLAIERIHLPFYLL